MNLLALDISSKAVGWTWMEGRKREAGGTLWRKGGEPLYTFAKRFDDKMWLAGPKAVVDRLVYEVNYAPVSRAKQKSVLLCNQFIGRVLQALGGEGEPYHADSKKKPKRREEMQLIYGKRKASEHEMDSLALAHRVVSEVLR